MTLVVVQLLFLVLIYVQKNSSSRIKENRQFENEYCSDITDVNHVKRLFPYNRSE